MGTPAILGWKKARLLAGHRGVWLWPVWHREKLTSMVNNALIRHNLLRVGEKEPPAVNDYRKAER